MADLDDHEEDDSNMSNVVESDQGGSDSGAGATPALPMGAREKQRKMLAIVLVVVLVVGGGVWAWTTYWREPEPPQTLCDGRISSREITRYLNATADSSTTDDVYYDCYIAFPDTADIEMMGIFVRDDGRIKLASMSGSALDETELLKEGKKDGVVTQLETYGLDGNAYSWTNNSGYFVYALWYSPDGVTVTLVISPQDENNQDIASNAQLAGLISYMGPALLSGHRLPVEKSTRK
ncbi:MAG: hypothetical protein ACFNXT_09075 [Actinomyces massiliensis]